MTPHSWLSCIQLRRIEAGASPAKRSHAASRSGTLLMPTATCLKMARPVSAPSARDPANDRFARIYTELRNRICTNRYPPGTVLNESELADEFGLSRTPIRSVLQKLNHDGLLETRNGVGTFVSEVNNRAAEDLYRLRMKLAELIGEFSPSVDPTVHIPKFESLLQRVGKLGTKPDFEAIGQINVAVTDAIADLFRH